MLFGICPSASHIPKFWHTFKITYDDFMVIVEPFTQCKLHLCLFLLNCKYYQNEIWSNASVLSVTYPNIFLVDQYTEQSMKAPTWLALSGEIFKISATRYSENALPGSVCF